MKIDKLKIVGFKSFADPTEVPIEPGVTAIVGPNGCGKSNVVEALRWAMGEMSAKRMRADGGMDDVIFGGTEARQPRASCEVSIRLDNRSRTAPQGMNDADFLDVVRRLDRGDGSSYKVNGKPARAKDVQVLFQDAGIGAASAALVSQGKVASIINAKPSDRRSILEEAAGVAGLSTRRHDAELKLRGTEQNLERADDMEKGLGDQLSVLRRQARQAARKRSIDDLIRNARAMAFLVRWRSAAERSQKTATDHAANEDRVGEAILALRAAEAEVGRVEEMVAPALRERQEAETAHALARARLEQAEKEVGAARAALNAARKSAERSLVDLERERSSMNELDEEIADLEDRRAIADDDREHDAIAMEEAGAVAAELEDEVGRLMVEVEALATEAAAAEAEIRAAEARRDDAGRRVGIFETKVSSARSAIAADETRLSAFGPRSDEVTKAEERLEIAEASFTEATEARTMASAAEDEARRRLSEASSNLAALRGELRGLLASAATDGAISDRVIVSDGFESALAAALGEGFSAGIGSGTARWWVKSGSRVAAPHGARSLLASVQLPPELEASVGAIGVVSDDAEGESLAVELLPGQAIVSLSGRMWRWDGYRTSGVGNAAEEVRRAARRRQLIEDEPGLASSEMEATSARDAAKKASEQARGLETRLADEVKQARASLDDLRRKREREDRERTELEARIGAAKSVLAASELDLAQAREELAVAVTALGDLPKIGDLSERLLTARRTMDQARARHASARSELDRVTREAGMRKTMIDGLVRSIEDSRKRRAAAETLCVEMAARLAEARAEEARLEALSFEAPAIVKKLREEADEFAAALVEAARRSSTSEALLADARQAVPQMNERLGAVREERARLLAELKAAKDVVDDLVREVSERLSCVPDELPMLAGVEVDAELPELQACEARIARLERERDGLGAVNPLAEAQANEMELKLGEAKKARDELREAVSRLRRTILEFDREARARLSDAYTLIDGHFRDLYTRIYGGGHAHLKLSGSEDILEAGLEIYACPPGKKLQSMSLLSGGEQALAALALIFAAFLIKPAPVCVLDEVDAPLDDANVNRFCSLVAEMARDDATRFLVITHHALTMARADRLYGVTMAERGVSKLTTMDMEQAAAFVGG